MTFACLLVDRPRFSVLVVLLAMAMPAPGEVVVTRSMSRNSDVSSAVDVIGAAELERAGTTSVADLLNSMPGVTGGRPAGSDGSAGLSLRGLGASQPLVLIDGRRAAVGIPRSGMGGIDLGTIPPDQIERVEILSSAAALTLYGSEAVDGVINIITRPNPSAEPDPVTPALGIYDSFIRGFSGSVDFNLNCDYGSAGVLPGTFLVPWPESYSLERFGDNFLVPFEQPAPDIAPGNEAQPNPAAGNANANAAPAAATPAGANSDASDNPAGDDSDGPGETGADVADAGQTADTGSAAPASGGADTDPQQTPAQPPLQQWDRGVPPWSLVQRSPEVAHLLEDLRPYYELRMEQRAEMSALGYWGLSADELAQNREAYNTARDIWKGTRREIITLLAPYIDPAIAATVATGDPIWNGDAGPVLPETVFGAGNTVVHPSQRAAQPAPDSGRLSDASGHSPSPDSRTGSDGEFKLGIGIEGLYGTLGRYEYEVQGEYLPDSDAIPADTLGSGARLGTGLGATLDVHPYLGQLQYKDDGSAEIKPAEGAMFSPNYPYETKLHLPLPGGLQDAEFNSDLGSQRGFGGSDGRVRYGDTSLDFDRFVTPRSGYSYEIGSAAQRTDTGFARYYGTYYDYQYAAPAAGTNAWRGTGRYQDYDTRMTVRDDVGRNSYDYSAGRFDFSAWRDNSATAPAGNWNYDLSRYRMGYNLGTGQAAITIPVNRYEGLTVRSDQAFGDAGNGASRAGAEWAPFVSSRWSIGNNFYTTFRWAEGAQPDIDISQVFGSTATVENDYCAAEAFPLNASLSSVLNDQGIADTWFIERIGAPDNVSGEPVVVAVIDTGLDYHHLDISWDNLWYNEREIRGNGIDDDNNGFVDDIIGWDFTLNSNTPWDHDGHGTFITGLIAARADNSSGIAGINPNARIMVLKALNNFGHTRASWLAQAIVYAVDNGARIINLSAAGPGLPEFVQDAVDYADRRGVLVFVAAGNSAENVDGIGPAGLDKVITVAAAGIEDTRAEFSNWGRRIDIAAPGVYIKSLRARQTDFRLTSLDGPYQRGSAILDGDRRAYRADGTSFAAPLVAGVASLIWSQNPRLTHTQVRRMLEQSARDIDTPGRDQFTGFGLVDAAAALAADPEYYTVAAINSVAIALVDGKQVARVIGTAEANKFREALLEVGAGDQPTSWKKIGRPLKAPVTDGVLGDISPQDLQGSPVWTVRVTTQHADKSTREARYRLNIGNQ